MLFDIGVIERGGWTVVSVTGELDVATAPGLRNQIVKLASNGTSKLLLDLSGVEFLDSTGLGVIIGALKRLKGLGGELRLCGGEPGIRRVFELTGLDKILHLYDTADAAISDTAGDGHG